MGETLDELKKCFYQYEVPQMLADLCEYWDKNPYFFAGEFELQPDKYECAKAWFQEKEKGYSRVLPFGVDGVGSLYAFWLYQDGITPSNAPIVFLDSEGEGSSVLAENFSDFMLILSSNRDYIGYDSAFYEYAQENKKESNRFRKWIKANYNLDFCNDPTPIMEKAKIKYPDFEQWIAKIKR
ncbi:MAG TPA: hypothetical protein DHW82_12675 [Spirochaetia bacterium]|nr:MAG: hypothetical protein A2Y41_06145 [Spirochaetes bacterium GWB1_36_13]HCL57844.1 hypothetical protein [Spirochaetia bacterium]